MTKRKYRILAGSHVVHNEAGQPTYYGIGEPAGDVIELEPEVAAKFVNKFTPHVDPVVVEAEDEPAPAPAPKPALAQAAKPK